MRSYALAAALAAALLSTSVGLGYAAAPSSTQQSMGATTQMQTTGKPAQPVAYTYMRHHPRLATVQNELGRAMHRINIEQRRGALTRHEARVARAEARQIRMKAMNVASRHDGRLTPANYAMLQNRIAGLNKTIHRFVVNSARA